ncbi:MAG: 4Fe-4S binding protein [Peptococcaceae bacterium]|nr:4Fe-4S binding protein [Peptococcaceae bacterium]
MPVPKKKAHVGKECVACGKCVKECPVRALSVYKGMYTLVGDPCIGCGKCAKTCPAGVIELIARKVEGATA